MVQKLKRWLAALAALAIIVPLAMNAHLGTSKREPEQPQALNAEAEKQQKQAALQHDVASTEKLMLAECAKDFQGLLAAGGQQQSRARQLQLLAKEHPQLEYMQWTDRLEPVRIGAIAPALSRSAAPYLQEAEAHIAAGTGYRSPSFSNEGHRYQIVSAASRAGHGIVGLVKMDLVSQVEQHQQRNLRLIPYPHEGKYRVESVEPGTRTDIKVRSGEDNGNASHYQTNEAIVRFNNDPDDAGMARIAKEIDGTMAKKLGYTYLFRSNSLSTEELIRYFQQNWNPIYVEPHYLYMTNVLPLAPALPTLPVQAGIDTPASGLGATGQTGTADSLATELTPIIPNDLLYAEYQWNLAAIHAEQSWNLGKGTEDVTVAVLDSGVQVDHPDLGGKLLQGINFIEQGASPTDDVGHGTHVAGIIAAGVNNYEGVAGLSWYNRVLPAKVLDSTGAGTTYSVAEGIIWATDQGAKVINMSLGNYASAQFLHDAIRYAYDRDVVLIAASGNDNTERPGYPAAYPEVFAVAATDESGNRASFSNYGDYIDVAAPGLGIASTYPGSQYAALSGTSMATPHVAALAALMRSANPLLSNEEIMELMRSTADDLGDPGHDKYFGHGQINMARALQAAEQSAYSLQRYPAQAARQLSKLAKGKSQ